MPRLELVSQLESMLLVSLSRVVVIIDLRRNIKNTLQRFYKINSILPTQALVYRDGVSDGEIFNVCPAEIEAVKGDFHPLR